MRVHEHTFAAFPSKQVIKRRIESFTLDVPQRNVNSRNSRHGHRTPAPVRSAVQILPDVLYMKWVPPDETGKHVFLKVRCDGQLAAIECGISQTVDALICFYLESDKVAVWRTDDESRFRNLHRTSTSAALPGR